MNSLVLPLAAIVLYSFALPLLRHVRRQQVARVILRAPTPAVTQADAAITLRPTSSFCSGTIRGDLCFGPLIGPVLAAQFGYLPGALWILFGAALGGAGHDFIFSSRRCAMARRPFRRIRAPGGRSARARSATAAILFHHEYCCWQGWPSSW